VIPESAFGTCWSLCDASEHGSGGSDADERLGDVGALLEIADETAVLDEPAEASANADRR
jgi:hypothetical protein